MKRILIITGHSGVGKSTVAKMFIQIDQDNQCSLLTFSEVGKRLAIKKGFSRLSEYFEGTDREDFKRELHKALLKEIDDKMQNTDFLVIEGLVYYDVILAVKYRYKKVLLVNIEVPYEIRVQRIAEKLGKSLQEAQRNEESKASLKNAIGIDKVIGCADYTLDGKKPVQVVVEELIKLTDDKWI